jgi:hypothetical protein
LPLLRWGALQIGDRLIIGEMFRCRSLEKGIRSLRLGLVELPRPDDVIARLQSLVQRWDLLGGIVRAYELERVISLDFLHAAAHDANVCPSIRVVEDDPAVSGIRPQPDSVARDDWRVERNAREILAGHEGEVAGTAANACKTFSESG